MGEEGGVGCGIEEGWGDGKVVGGEEVQGWWGGGEGDGEEGGKVEAERFARQAGREVEAGLCRLGQVRAWMCRGKGGRSHGHAMADGQLLGPGQLREGERVDRRSDGGPSTAPGESFHLPLEALGFMFLGWKGLTLPEHGERGNVILRGVSPLVAEGLMAPGGFPARNG